MKIKQLICVLLTGSLTTVIYASPLFQAGNIKDGQQWPISTHSGVASYYADGKSGNVQFSCILRGDKTGNSIKAILMTGKNFSNKYNMPMTELVKGTNGPFNWKLTNEHEDSGNIKVNYVSGSNVNVQCYEISR